MTNEEKLFELFKNGADGAIPNDARVEKVLGEKEDHHEIGSQGVVKGSHVAPPIDNGVVKYACDYVYLVQFDGDESLTFIAGSKIKEI